jgi:hypothetical protein
MQYNYGSKLLKYVIEESEINGNNGSDMPKIKTSSNVKFSDHISTKYSTEFSVYQRAQSISLS